jgi:cobyric acid synthase CobQ
MGRAQVLQAAACRLEPDVKMNPVLLKPNSETGSQVILLGKAVGHMGYDAYTALKADMLEKIHGAYDELAAEYEVMVIEGAGSPAEINLKPRDIVNMHMAEYAEAPVLLVGDIERGGIFASFVGTLELLTEAERERIAGFVINRFRGDARLLDTGIDYLARRTGRPVLGCIPYLNDLGLPEEDSVSMKNRPSRGPTEDSRKLDVAVVDLPHISNFTDFDPLGIEPDVSLRMVRRVEELSSADMVIIPGSKNVLHDLDYLRTSGIASRVLELGRDRKAFCIGICGGFQMLGERISDPMAVETPDGKQSEALGLLPVETTLMPEKTLALTRATHLPTGLEVQGYEIHHGRSSCDAVRPLWKNAAGEVIGVGSEDGRIWGTYLHGVFDNDDFRRWLIDRARSALGKPATGTCGARFEIDSALDRLADAIRRHSDIERIMRLAGIQ